MVANRSGDRTVSSGRSIHDLQEFVGIKLAKMKEQQLAQRLESRMAGFVSDFVMREGIREIPFLKAMDAVVIVTDISGFTTLSEMYTLKGKGGTEHLTKTLAGFLGPLVECILMTKGDIIKFAGDAFLSVWQVHKGQDFQETLQTVIDCALYCQEKYGSYPTDVGTTIRVKIGIGCGRTFYAEVGDTHNLQYVVFGPAVVFAGLAEHHCESGQVVVHPSVWNYCQKNHFQLIDVGDGCLRVLAINNFVNPAARGRPVLKQTISEIPEIKSPVRHSIMQLLGGPITTKLRRFILPFVLKNLDDNIPYEFLNESRMVAIAFVHVKHVTPHPPVTNPEAFATVHVVQKSFIIALTHAAAFHGCINKIVMFDKGLTYLVVFGLPGTTAENVTASALKFAQRTQAQLSTLNQVVEVSIGVTTGSCYCGILGHPLRHEYTVIGKRVNEAARLMCNYQGLVSCSHDSMYNSRLPVHHFVQLEAKFLKGVSNMGKVFNYIGEEAGEGGLKTYHYPILGRKEERQMIMSVLKKRQLRLLEAVRKQDSLVSPSVVTIMDDSIPSILVIEGETGIGKSRLQAKILQDAETLRWRIFHVSLNAFTDDSELSPMYNLLSQAFGLDRFREPADRQAHLNMLARACKDNETFSELNVLNEILQLQLPPSPKLAFLDSKSRQALVQRKINQILRFVHAKTSVIFSIEDAHLLGQANWEYIQSISKLPQILFIMTLLRNSDGLPKIPTVAYKICYHTPTTYVLKLGPLQPHWILPLCCQVLEVKGIPIELEKILIAKSDGNPGWIEDFLKDLSLHEHLKIVSIKEQDPILKLYPDLAVVNSKYITKEENKTIKSQIQIMNATHYNPHLRISLMRQQGSISGGTTKETGKELILQTFDGMNPTEQMLVKCASVLGGRFSRSMLTRLLPFYARDAKKYLLGFCKLMESKIFKCATSKRKNSGIGTRVQQPAEVKDTGVECFCTPDESFSWLSDLRPDFNFPRHCYCRYTEFTRDSMAGIVYDLLTEKVRKNLHSKVAQYMESLPIQCDGCGGPPTTYVFGFSLATSEFHSHPNEDVLRTWTRTNQHIRKYASMETSRRHLFTSLRIRKQYSDVYGDLPLEHNIYRDVSVDNSNSQSTNIPQEVPRVYGIPSTQVAMIEAEILKSIGTPPRKRFNNLSKFTGWISTIFRKKRKPRTSKKFHRQHSLKNLLRLHRKKKSRYEAAMSTVSIAGHLPSVRADGDKSLHSQKIGGGDRSFMTDLKSEMSQGNISLEDTAGFDFRGCECSAIYAKVCMNLIKHYREAGIKSKWLVYLLEAAETIIAVGNKDLALQFLTDAQDLLEDIKGDGTTPDGGYEAMTLNLPEIGRQIVFLQAYTYYELGATVQAKQLFVKFLKMARVVVPNESDRNAIRVALRLVTCQMLKAKLRNTWHKKHESRRKEKLATLGSYKLRALSYLHKLYRNENKIELALLVSLWQLIFAKEMGGTLSDLVPANCDVIETYLLMSKPKEANFLEKKAVEYVRDHLGTEMLMDPMELLATANLFFHLGKFRLAQGEYERSTDASYIALRISHILHDTTLQIHAFPYLIMALISTLNIPDVLESLQTHWYISRSQNDGRGIGYYYILVLVLINELCIPIESFYRCEEFAAGREWKEAAGAIRGSNLQYCFASAIALFYTRFMKWDKALKWTAHAKGCTDLVNSPITVYGKLSLIQCYLINAHFHSQKKRFQLANNDLSEAKGLFKEVQQSLGSCPMFEPRYNHMQAYYFKIRDQKPRTNNFLNKAAELAKNQCNWLELEFVKHTRSVWSSQANPNVRYYWMENAERSGWEKGLMKEAWSNVMYSLPSPMWTA